MLEERKIISLGIPDDIFDEVEEVTRALFEYKNPNKLNWNKSYEDVLIKLGKKDKLKDLGDSLWHPKIRRRTKRIRKRNHKTRILGRQSEIK